MLVKHSNQVNCVRWLVAGIKVKYYVLAMHSKLLSTLFLDEVLLTTSNDKSALIWKFNASLNQFEITVELTGHEAPVTVGDAVIEGTTSFAVTASSDFALKFWSNDIPIAEHKLKNYVFDVKIVSQQFWLERSRVIAYASGDEFVHLIQLTTDQKIIELIKLSGHEDWVRSVDCILKTIDNRQVLMIASGAQDNFIRVWTVEATSAVARTEVNEQIFDIDSDSRQRFVVKLDTVLSSHDGWVHAVKWIKPGAASGQDSALRLLSASMDKTMVLWQESERDVSGDVCGQVWIEAGRFGEVGGLCGGFLGATFPKAGDFRTFAGHSFNGAVHTWTQCPETNSWKPGIGFGGHFDVVR